MIGRVFLLPDDLPSDEITSSTAVVIDVLRATTTICQALAAGARAVWPCETVEEAMARAGTIGREACLLGGERGGVRIEGFDLGNSPLEYTPERVAGKDIVFTTTNGTRAMAAARGARRILLGALVNRAGLCRRIPADTDLSIICAGTRGQVTNEDVLCAGAIVAALRGDDRWAWSDTALEAARMWDAVGPVPDALIGALRNSTGGRDLTALGYESDILAAARLDSMDVVPVVNDSGKIVVMA